MAGAGVRSTAPPCRRARRISRGRRLGRRRARRQTGTRGSSPCCRGSAASRGARPAIAPRSRSSPPTSTPCFSSAGSTAISIRAESSATCSWRWESGAAPVDRAEQGGPRRRSRSAYVEEVQSAGASGAPCTRSRAVDAGDARRAARLSRPRPDRRAARLVRRRQVDHRQPAGRPRAAAHAGRA